MQEWNFHFSPFREGQFEEYVISKDMVLMVELNHWGTEEDSLNTIWVMVGPPEAMN